MLSPKFDQVRPAVIVIKKYPNRRLYDTSKSQYINLESLKGLVIEHKEFQVIDSKSEADLTKSILLQIITEQEGITDRAVLTQGVLENLIRFTAGTQQQEVRAQIEQCVTSIHHNISTANLESPTPDLGS